MEEAWASATFSLQNRGVIFFVFIKLHSTLCAKTCFDLYSSADFLFLLSAFKKFCTYQSHAEFLWILFLILAKNLLE